MTGSDGVICLWKHNIGMESRSLPVLLICLKTPEFEGGTWRFKGSRETAAFLGDFIARKFTSTSRKTQDVQTSGI